MQSKRVQSALPEQYKFRNLSTHPHHEYERPAREEDEVAHEEPGDPDHGQPHVHKLEAGGRPGEEVPTLKVRMWSLHWCCHLRPPDLFSRGKIQFPVV